MRFNIRQGQNDNVPYNTLRSNQFWSCSVSAISVDSSARDRLLRQRADSFLKMSDRRSHNFTWLEDGVGGRRSWAAGSAQRTSVAQSYVYRRISMYVNRWRPTFSCCSRHCHSGRHDIGSATYWTTTTVLYDVGIATYRRGAIPRSRQHTLGQRNGVRNDYKFKTRRNRIDYENHFWRIVIYFNYTLVTCN